MRRLIAALATTAVLAALANFALWWTAERQLAAGLDAWRNGLVAEGWVVGYATPERGGWPIAATLTLPSYHLAGGQTALPDGLDWSGHDLVLGASLLHPFGLEIRPRGDQRLRLGTLPPLEIGARRLEVVASNGSHGAGAANVFGKAVTLSGPDGAAYGVADLTLHTDWHPQAAGTEPALAVSMRAELVSMPPTMPGGAAWPLGSRLSSVSIDAVADGPLPQTGPIIARAASWRDGGGALRVSHLAFGWGPLGASGEAEARLDTTLQPAGRAQLHLLGVSESLDTLGTAGVIPSRVVTAIKGVTTLLAQPAPGGDTTTQIVVPITVSGGVLSIAGFPILHLPPIAWTTP